MTKATSQSVSCEAGNSSTGISRRQAMNIMTAVAAVPAVGFPSAALPFTPTDRRAWNAAVARYERATEKVERVGNDNMEAHDAAEAACPRNDEYFSRYNMGRGDSPDRNFRACHMSLVIERTKEGPLTPDEAKQTAVDAQRLVDEFEAYSASRDAAFAGYDQLEDRFDRVVDEQAEARKLLIETPAPDNEALLYKIEMLAAYLTECASEDADRLNAVSADARRLLTVGRA